MSKMIPVYHKGAIRTFEVPIVPRVKATLENMSKEEHDEKVVKKTFVDAVTGHRVLATMAQVVAAEERISEAYNYDECASWADLWFEIDNDELPWLSVAGGGNRAYVLAMKEEKGLRADFAYPICIGIASLGWSKEYERQMNGDDAPITPLKFYNIWDPDANVYWIVSNILPIVGYMEY